MYSHNGTQLSDKDDWTANTCSIMDKSHQHDFELKKARHYRYILFNCMYIKFKNKLNSPLVKKKVGTGRSDWKLTVDNFLHLNWGVDYMGG